MNFSKDIKKEVSKDFEIFLSEELKLEYIKDKSKEEGFIGFTVMDVALSQFKKIREYSDEIESEGYIPTSKVLKERELLNYENLKDSNSNFLKNSLDKKFDLIFNPKTEKEKDLIKNRIKNEYNFLHQEVSSDKKEQFVSDILFKNITKNDILNIEEVIDCQRDENHYINKINQLHESQVLFLFEIIPQIGNKLPPFSFNREAYFKMPSFIYSLQGENEREVKQNIDEKIMRDEKSLTFLLDVEQKGLSHFSTGLKTDEDATNVFVDEFSKVLKEDKNIFPSEKSSPTRLELRAKVDSLIRLVAEEKIKFIIMEMVKLEGMKKNEDYDFLSKGIKL